VSKESEVSSGSYGDTSGSDSRESRPMMDKLMVFSIAAELQRLRTESPWTDGDRNSRTLAKDVDFRLLLATLRDGATLEEQHGEARASVQLLDGRAVLRLGGRSLLAAAEEAELSAGDVATVDAGGPWELEARGECAFLLTLAWPREKSDPPSDT
jgi:mannose-6-phosphate isomerase-like protein (cupin superfamily)